MAPYCDDAGVSKLLVGRLADVDCKATIYNGDGCILGTETSVTDIPAGSGDVCVATGDVLGDCVYCPKIGFEYSCGG
ncbi:hypothetical protein MMC14_006158 [Varicellaria rhodocarpa]|nr:hypothetical protein [Varicellaria rhodocarpa]